MKNKEYTHLREQVHKVEEKIIAITGKNVEFNMEWTRSQRKCEQVEKMIWKLGKSEGYDDLRLYALDRIKALEQTERKFKLPKKFNAEKFFADYYGIIIGDEEFDVGPVALKVDSWQSKSIRTLPLYHSQVEVVRNDEYSIFEYRLCPSFDFQQKLLSMGDSVGVLAPVLLKDILRKKAEKTVNNNASAGMGSQYHFKVYKK